MCKATFIGHSKCGKVNADEIEKYLIELIELGVEEFLCGGMGEFDILCAAILHKLKKKYSSVKCMLVIPYLTFKTPYKEYFDETIYPEGLEKYHFKAAIVERNKYLVDNSDYAVCYVGHDWGGAAKTYTRAVRGGVIVKNFAEP